jgi:hypothetical protein
LKEEVEVQDTKALAEDTHTETDDDTPMEVILTYWKCYTYFTIVSCGVLDVVKGDKRINSIAT